jgi:chemosensory pili system protein ChpA (sensor histidine kinase/response regulator)
MSVPEPTSINASVDLAEAQLQQELRSMFAVDTQRYLETYINLAQQLQSQSWTADIQELYRSVHTIKGGAVTVGADAILYVSTILEDLLSDLRYLNTAPPLEDGKLSQMLLEAGELLASSLQVNAAGNEAKAAVQPTIRRIQVLREEIQQSYLPEWSEQKQLHQEFAEHGFDLVVLDLEMALEELAQEEIVPETTVDLAKQTVEQLKQIGQDLQFAGGWEKLLEDSQIFFTHQESNFWQFHWWEFLETLKNCAREGGILKTSAKEIAREESFWSNNLVETDSETIIFSHEPTASNPNSEQESPVWSPSTELASVSEGLTSPSPHLAARQGERGSQGAEYEENPSGTAHDPSACTPRQTSLQLSAHRPQATEEPELQIPVPLGRLERTAQNLVATLLTVRASQGLYQNLQSQLMKIFALAQESVHYISRLRQIQDEYALLDGIQGSNSSSSENLSLERYRQGYITINRLLETSLRLSELGAEATTTAQQTAESLQSLERNFLQLQRTVEESRMVPFKNLGFRARAILRDLSNRYGKPAQLIVQGEELELDAGTVSKLEPTLLHLLRNAYDHGLEFPEERIALSKPERGTITLGLARQGNSFLLYIRDDGRGIDTAVIENIAKAKGLPLTNTKTPADILALICQPSFSSKEQISDISGRGVGMDVVANQIASLGGKLSLDTVPGSGTTFYIRIPVPHLLVSCVLVQAGNYSFAIPTSDIVTTTLWSELTEAQITEDKCLYSWMIREGEITVPGLDLLEYWQTQSSAGRGSGADRLGTFSESQAAPLRGGCFEQAQSVSRTLSDTAVCVSICSLETQQRVWLIADDLLGQTDLLIYSIPSPLISPVGLMGVSLHIDGTLIPVLDGIALAKHLHSTNAVVGAKEKTDTMIQTGQPLQPASSEQPENLTHTILVVDDAALMRRRIEASLNAFGYIVQTCTDGQEAWNWLQTHPQPHLLITDIEMPNMDGFTLIDHCRQAGIGIPILVISSRLSEEWSKEAHRVGATDYLTKGFSTTELTNKVKSLIQ